MRNVDATLWDNFEEEQTKRCLSKVKESSFETSLMTYFVVLGAMIFLFNVYLRTAFKSRLSLILSRKHGCICQSLVDDRCQSKTWINLKLATFNRKKSRLGISQSQITIEKRNRRQFILKPGAVFCSEPGIDWSPFCLMIQWIKHGSNSMQ